MSYTIAHTERIHVVKQRLARMDYLENQIAWKIAALRNKRKFTGKDARRLVMLFEAKARLNCLHPFHRVRTLP